MRLLWTIAAALLVAATFASADDAEPTGGAVKDRDNFIPKRQYAPLKGTAVGILVDDVKAIMAHDGRGGPADAMGFSVDDKSHRWIYVQTDAKNPQVTGLNVEVGEKANDKRKMYTKLNLATPKEVKRWGIEVPYSLVEVEVNDGLGSPATEGFVATKMTRIDGTEKFPLKLPDVIADAKKRYKAHVANRQKKIDGEMAAVQKKVLKDRKVSGPKETSELLHVTWLPESKRVKVSFRTRQTDGAYTETTVRGGGGIRPLPALEPPPAKKGSGKEKRMAFRPPAPIETKVKYGVGWGVEYGMAYEYDVKGKLVERRELTPLSFSVEILAPQGGGIRD